MGVDKNTKNGQNSGLIFDALCRIIKASCSSMILTNAKVTFTAAQ
jgi:hypothetical protein